ncbi:MAG: NAD-dependent epimerase/dehydratase family protein [Desulfurivibrionaceae bacterium]
MLEKLLNVLNEDIETIIDRDLPWEHLQGCRILVTGAGGFLGGYLTRTLLALHRLGKVSIPVKVVAMVRNLGRERELFPDLMENPDFELLEWDLNTIGIPDIGQVNYIIHAASHASPRFYGGDPVGTLLPNAVGTAALLEALRRSEDPRGLLFVSSSEIYGAVTVDLSLSETQYGVVDPATVRACYSESKRIGETMCVAWHEQYAIPTFIVRPFHTYGPGLQPEDGRVFADFAFNIIRNENIAMNSDGMASRAFCYVTDAVAGLFYVLLKGSPTLPYNVANPAGELSVMELAQMLVGLFPEKGLTVEQHFNITEKDYMPSNYSRLIPDVTRLESLGWRAKVEPVQGFKRMIEAYKS